MHRRALLKQVLHAKGGAPDVDTEKEDLEFLERKRRKKEEEKKAEEAKKSLLEKHNELLEAEIGKHLNCPSILTGSSHFKFFFQETEIQKKRNEKRSRNYWKVLRLGQVIITLYLYIYIFNFWHQIFQYLLIFQLSWLLLKLPEVSNTRNQLRPGFLLYSCYLFSS